MSTPASKPEFSKGVVEPVGDCGMFEAAIDHLTTDNNVMTPHGPDTDASKPPSDWGGRIVMYGKTAEQAEALRERILVALELCRGAEMEWLRGFNSNPHRLPVDQHIERAMGHAGAAEVELVRQVTDGGRNPRYEGLFEGETEEQRASRLAPATEQPAKLCMGCVEQSSRIRELEHKMDYYRAASPAAGTETLPFWEPCNPGCDPEFNGQRSKWCAQLCQPAREALSVSAGGVDDRAAFEAWYETTYGISLEPEFRANHFIGYVNDKANHRWAAWQARAALSAPDHSEQVRHMVPDGWKLVPVEPTHEMLGAALMNQVECLDAIAVIRTDYKATLAAAPVQQDQAFCEYCGGNDEEPQDHCMDCTRPAQQVSVPDEMRSLAQRLREYNQNPHHINPMSEAFHILVADAANALSAACVPKEIAAAITWSEHLLFECGALTSTRAPSVHVYNKTFAAVNEARAMLNAAPAAPAADAGIVDMYRHLQKVTPYRFKKIQDASITDGGDVMYFHKDRFDAALLADMAAHCAAKGVV